MRTALIVGLTPTILLCSWKAWCRQVDSPTIDPREAQVKGYRSWKRVTSNGVDMSPAIAVSCVGPRTWDQHPNPHVAKVFLVYVNKAGQSAMSKVGKTQFPDGTVIVKEKYTRPPVWGENAPLVVATGYKALQKSRPELLTVMAKKDGEWDFYAVGADGKVLEGDNFE